MNTIIIDFDGTIADTKHLIVSTMQQTMSILGLPVKNEEECSSVIGLPLRQTFTALIPMDEQTADACDNTYRRLFNENNRPGVVKLFPHVKETLEELYAMGIVIAVASSRGSDTLHAFLEEMQLSQYISYVVTSQDVENAKPAPDMVYNILGRIDDDKSDVLVVGDTIFDIDMGINAGVKTCGVTYGNGNIEELSKADFVISDFHSLLDIV